MKKKNLIYFTNARSLFESLDQIENDIKLSNIMNDGCL